MGLPGKRRETVSFRIAYYNMNNVVIRYSKEYVWDTAAG